MNLDFKNTTDKIIDKSKIQDLAKYKDVIIFGAGETGAYLLSILKQYNINPICFCDNYKGKQGTEKENLIVYSPEDAVKKYPNACICIGSLWADEIKRQIQISFPSFNNKIFIIFSPMVWELKEKQLLSSEGNYIRNNEKTLNSIYNYFKDEKSKLIFENLINFRLTRRRWYLEKSYCPSEQYFDTEIIDPEHFLKTGYCVDGGAFDGDSVNRFFELFPKSNYIFQCYEPDEKNINNFMKRESLIKNHKIIIHKAGLYNISSMKGFVSGNSMGASVEETSSGHLKLETIDELPTDKPILFIKLDIEGAEIKALQGGYKRIIKDRPILAICAYHLQDDLIKLPEFIHKLPNYELYLRHYMIAPSETILYGIPVERIKER